MVSHKSKILGAGALFFAFLIPPRSYECSQEEGPLFACMCLLAKDNREEVANQKKELTEYKKQRAGEKKRMFVSILVLLPFCSLLACAALFVLLLLCRFRYFCLCRLLVLS